MTFLPLRIAFVAERTPFTRSEQRMRALDDLGAEVFPISLIPPASDPAVLPERRLVDRVAAKLGRPLDRAGANRTLLEVARDHRPDVIWVEGGRILRPSTLRELARVAPGAPRVLFTEDDLAFAHNRSAYQTAGLSAYDLVVTTKRRNVERRQLDSLGVRDLHYESKSFDPWFHRPLWPRPDDRDRLGAPIGFIGTYERQRASSCLALAEAGFEVRVFGNGWNRLREFHPRLRVEGHPLGGEDYVRSIGATDINLGFLRRANEDRHTDRSVEIPACAGFLLAERTEEHLELFEEGREAAYFEGDDELIELCGRYLADDTARRAIAQAGRERCIASGYDHPSSVMRVLERALRGAQAPAPETAEAA